MTASEKLKPRKLPSQQRAEKRVAEIIAAYRRLLDGDVRRITTNRIAEEAGVPVSSLYQYFPNKESIAFAVYRQWAEQALDVLRARREEAATASSWQAYLLQGPDSFFNDPVSARIVHQLGPVMETSPELKSAQRDVIAQMVALTADTLRVLGSDWPEKPLANIVSLLIELNTTTFRHIARQSGSLVDETFGHWQSIARTLLQRCIETPYADIAATEKSRRKPAAERA
jgi:AcrR family transcriptional regulator